LICRDTDKGFNPPLAHFTVKINCKCVELSIQMTVSIISYYIPENCHMCRKMHKEEMCDALIGVVLKLYTPCILAVNHFFLFQVTQWSPCRWYNTETCRR
jgi:hypothetical protein